MRGTHLLPHLGLRERQSRGAEAPQAAGHRFATRQGAQGPVAPLHHRAEALEVLTSERRRIELKPPASVCQAGALLSQRSSMKKR